MKIEKQRFMGIIEHTNESRVEHMAEGEEREAMLRYVESTNRPNERWHQNYSIS